MDESDNERIDRMVTHLLDRLTNEAGGFRALARFMIELDDKRRDGSLLTMTDQEAYNRLNALLDEEKGGNGAGT